MARRDRPRQGVEYPKAPKAAAGKWVLSGPAIRKPACKALARDMRIRLAAEEAFRCVELMTWTWERLSPDDRARYRDCALRALREILREVLE